MPNQALITLSTNPSKGKGGVSTSVQYLNIAISNKYGIFHSLVTHDHTPFFGKWLPFLKASLLLTILIIKCRSNSTKPIVWAHVGGPVSLFRKFILISLARLLGAEIILHLHSVSTERFLDGGLRQSVFEFLLSPAHKVVVVSEWWRSRLLDSRISKPIYVCTNCLGDFTDGAKINKLKQSSKIDNSAIRILAMSRMVEGKGFDLILEGLVLCPGTYEVLMAGDGELRSKLEAQVKRSGLEDRVKFVGWVDENRKAELLQSVDIFCLPSQNDSFGMVYLEAMQAGLPIIAFDYPPVRAVIGEHAALYIKTPQELSVSLENLLSSQQMRQIMGAAGIERVVAQYSMENVKKQISYILTDLKGG